MVMHGHQEIAAGGLAEVKADLGSCFRCRWNHPRTRFLSPKPAAAAAAQCSVGIAVLCIHPEAAASPGSAQADRMHQVVATITAEESLGAVARPAALV
eukprot:scaffold2824_cov372-Prasinococcus_capsulatus_cf.AAC.8